MALVERALLVTWVVKMVSQSTKSTNSHFYHQSPTNSSPVQIQPPIPILVISTPLRFGLTIVRNCQCGPIRFKSHHYKITYPLSNPPPPPHPNSNPNPNQMIPTATTIMIIQTSVTNGINPTQFHFLI